MLLGAGQPHPAQSTTFQAPPKPVGKMEPTGQIFNADGEPTFFLRMRGLPWGTRKEEIQKFFESIEMPEQNIMILILPDGKSSGEALVGLNSQEEYDSCMRFEKKYIGTRYIELYASSQAEWDRVHNRHNRVLPIPIKEGSFIVLMRGLPYSAHEDDCIDFFKDVKPLGVHLPKDSMGRPSGQGYAEFETREDFQKAMEHNKQHMLTRYIELFESNAADLQRAMNPGPGVDIVPRKSRDNDYHYPQPYPAQNNSNPYVTSVVQPQPYCLKMRGLPYNTSETEITRFFAEAKVTPMRIHRKADGAEAFVEFQTAEEQANALKLHKAFLGRRYVELFAISFEEVSSKVGLRPPQREQWRGGPPAGPYNPHQHYQPPHHGGYGGGNPQYQRRYQPYGVKGAVNHHAKRW